MAVLKIFDGTKWVAARSVVVSGVCSTASATVAKVVTISGYTPTPGDILAITFTNGNSAVSPTLNINGTGAKNIKLGSTNASTTTMTVGANGCVLMYYTGTSFQLMGSHRTSDATVPVATQTEIDNGTAVNKYVRPDRLKIMLDSKGYQTEAQVQDAINNELWVTFKDFLTDGDIVVYDAINAENLYNLNGGSLRLWKGTQAQYDALPSVTKNNPDFIFFTQNKVGQGSSSNSYEWLEQVVLSPGYSQSITELFQNYGPGEYIFDIYTQETSGHSPIQVSSTVSGTIFDSHYTDVHAISYLNTLPGGQYYGHIVIKMSVTNVNVTGIYTSSTGGSNYNGVFMGNPNMETFTIYATDASNNFTIDVYKLGGA
jgi:hypothetical protein